MRNGHERLAQRINADRMKSVLTLIGFLLCAPRLFNAAAAYEGFGDKPAATPMTAPIVAALMVAEQRF